MNSRRASIALVAMVGLGLVFVALWRQGGPQEAPARAAAVGSPSERAQALTVLRGWDRQRAAAYAAGDAAALRALYVPGSRSGRNDQRLLRAYAARGLRVEDLRTQVLSIDIREHSALRLTLEVNDRLASAVAVGVGFRAELPRDAATQRIVELRRVDDRWLVVEVRTVGQPSAAARTSFTPGSLNS